MKRIHTLTTPLVGITAALLLGAMPAWSEEITARFRPDPSNPLVNRFENTTPISSICAAHIPARCKQLGIFSLRDESFTSATIAPIVANHEDERQGFMVKVPSDWRDLQVTHARTGETETVQLRIAGIGGYWVVPRPPGVSGWAQEGTWQAQWMRAPAPCDSTSHLAAGTANASFFWLTPENAGACSRKPSQDMAYMRMSTMEYAYELRTPNPLGMSSGVYTGSITYSMGPGGDYDFGDVMIPSKSAITFNFTLSVEHELRVEVPPGGNRVELIPQGGWQAWLNQGRVPVRLFRDQAFLIASSSRFKMTLECGQVMDNTCGLQNEAGHQVPVDIKVSLPHGLNDPSGQAVNRVPLLLDGSRTELFQPGFYVDRKPGTLHFEVDKEQVASMLEQAGSTYRGTATVIWDTEI
ncbi:hypothetical protein SAMN04487857_110190 [Pseudomonas sp. ok272]|uniref:hypothetical protein n=1 Tax=unclassified Pseudomonas TaxID=196821 RepID=UPI0008B267CE|nr:MULTISPECIES: hypothetical protein [unclassified Pseudomonas]SEN14703.1 hypothetical protein SAMN04487857_110190 [Pseudomonas sp. ok272]SFN07149.1 hypothetical protein SAMN04487858_111191 [Pseudomonas sp. ok602]